MSRDRESSVQSPPLSLELLSLLDPSLQLSLLNPLSLERQLPLRLPDGSPILRSATTPTTAIPSAINIKTAAVPTPGT